MGLCTCGHDTRTVSDHTLEDNRRNAVSNTCESAHVPLSTTPAIRKSAAHCQSCWAGCHDSSTYYAQRCLQSVYHASVGMDDRQRQAFDHCCMLNCQRSRELAEAAVHLPRSAGTGVRLRLAQHKAFEALRQLQRRTCKQPTNTLLSCAVMLDHCIDKSEALSRSYARASSPRSCRPRNAASCDAAPLPSA